MKNIDAMAKRARRELHWIDADVESWKQDVRDRPDWALAAMHELLEHEQRPCTEFQGAMETADVA